MEFRLFGEVEMLAAGQPLDVGTPRQQAVLAALLVDAGRPVTVETLVDRVWGDTPPVEVRNVLYSHLSRIRRMLAHAAAVAGTPALRIERRHAGYVLAVDPDVIDLHRFERLVNRGRDPRCPDDDRVSALAEAMGLWRGTPLTALAGEWVAQVRASWRRRRLEAAVEWARVELRLGRPADVVRILPDLVDEYPLAEPLEGLLMEALHTAGRDAEAIDRYFSIRQRLADELGTEPGLELRRLHQAILRGELPASPPPSQTVATAWTAAAPAQLPPDVYGFTGRESQLRYLDRLLAMAEGPPVVERSSELGWAAAGAGGTAAILAIDGTAGIGKTALAVHWAHRVADRFPDGQLYVNLQGFDPIGSPVTPAEAVRRFLDAFEVSPERVPADFEAQVGLYRSLIAHRRVLVVLDNARDSDQVRPLLPGAGSCMALITSRHQLLGLVAATGAHSLTLDLPTAVEARELLARRLGTDRVAAEPDPIAEIITLCARLPLALAIVAARAATHPTFGLAILAAELREARGGLDEFAGADPAMDARTVFSWSYQLLSPGAARLFRLLGLHPGPDVATPAVASLAGLPVGKVRPLLAELTRAHLLAEHLPGRYAYHDLLRAYASELTRAIDSDADRDTALGRALGYYAHSADQAHRLLNPYRDGAVPLPPVPPGVGPECPADREQALAWFDAEHPVLLAVVRQVSDFDAHVCQLAWTLTRFFGYRGYWQDSVTALDAALAAAGRLADPARLAVAHRLLGCAYVRLGRFDDAQAHLRDALYLYREAGDAVGEAHTHRHHAWLLEQQHRHQEALRYARQALELFRAAGHRSGQARALNAIGWFHAMLGGYEDAISYCHQALVLQRELGDRFGQAETCDSLGYAYLHLGHHASAVTCYQTAAELYREFDDRYNEADTTASLGDVHYSAGNFGSARTAWERALDVLEQIGHPDANEVRAKLDKLDDPRGRRRSSRSGSDTPPTAPPNLAIPLGQSG